MIKTRTLHFALHSFLRFLLIAPFNILIIAIPGLITFGLIFLTWTLAIALLAIGFGTPVVAFQTELIFSSIWMATAVFSTSLFSFFMSICIGIFVLYISKHFTIYILSYLYWNFRFIFKKKTKA